MFVESLLFVKDNFKNYFKSALNYFFIFFLLTIAFDFIKLSLGQGHGSAEFIVGISEVLATYLFYALLIRKSFALIDGVEELGSFSKLGVDFFIYLRVNIVYSLLFLVGGLFILPGVWVMVFLFFAPMVTLDQSYKEGKYFKRSIELVKRSVWVTLCLSLVSLSIMSIDFALFPYIKESSFKFSGMFAKNFVIIILDFFFLLFASKVYKSLAKS
jgi:hypothetical protein